MTANQDLQRRLSDFYADEPPSRAPDWVLQAAVTTIESTPQRRGLLAPWRFNPMSMYAKLGAATVAVVAVAAIAVWQLAPAPTDPGTSPGTPSPGPTATRQPTVAPPSEPGAYVPAVLTETFTSDVHGITVSYPAGWTARAATEPWTTGGEPVFNDSAGDHLYDPRLGDSMILTLASQPLGDTSFDAWADPAGRIGDLCTETEPVVVDGADGVRCGPIVLVSSGGRGYLILLRKSNDLEELRAFDATDWFTEVLATIQLEPEKAVGAP